MKKIYGFLGAAALLAMVGCSKEDVTGSGPKTETKGGLFMTMNIMQGASSRTATPNQGKENGKDYESDIQSLIVILADKDDSNGYKVFATKTITSADIVGVQPYKASFEFDRDDILQDIEDNGEDNGEGNEKKYYIFVIANPGNVTAPTTNVQGTFSVSSLTDDTYWDVDNKKFLMTNADVAVKTIKASEIPVGTHTTKGEAYNLGTVTVQRAMSRFDIAKDNTTENNVNTSDLKVEIDAVALVNEAKSAYLFKVMAENSTSFASLPTNNPISFGDERKNDFASYWVFSPEQDSYWAPLFEGVTGNAEEGFSSTSVNGFGTLSYTTIASLTNKDDTDYTEPTVGPTGENNDYYIWRYCMENTNPDDPKYQKGANSTGVAFRAELTGNVITQANNQPIYAYNNVVIGNAEQLQTYATSNKGKDEETGLYDDIVTIYDKAVADQKSKNDQWDGSGEEGKGSLSDLDGFLVKEKFTIYRPVEGHYYCYYLYWNRHNDNGQSTVMGTMEFATVRNNVYKLAVTKINRLGHPGEPGDDPETPGPDDPNEDDTFWFEVTCEILPWEVRINNIDF